MGHVRVFFDSGHPDVEILERLKNDPRMWVALTEAKVSSHGFEADIKPPEGEVFTVYAPWEAVHTLEASIQEVHVWTADLEDAERRHSKGYVSEMKN